MKQARQPKIYWHDILGTLFELLFTHLGVEVQVDFKLMSEPPRADILLLRRHSPIWTLAQLACLPDGIRHNQAQYILIEFKYTESLSAHTIDKTHAYDVLLRDTQNLTKKEVATFILTAKTPRPALLKQYGYVPTEWPGVYYSNALMVNRVGLIVLNQLSSAPHNAYVKCFASRKNEQRAAFETLETLEVSFSHILNLFLATLYRLLSQPGELDMIRKGIKGEDLLKWGEQLQEQLLDTMSVEQRLMGLPPAKVFSHYKPDEVLAHYQTDEVLAHYQTDEVLAHYQTDEVLAHYQTDEVLAHYQTDEVLAHYQTDEVLAHYQTELAQREQEASRQTMLKNWQQVLQIRFNLSLEALQRYAVRGQKLTLETLELLYKRTLLADNLSQFDHDLAQLERAAIANEEKNEQRSQNL